MDSFPADALARSAADAAGAWRLWLGVEHGRDTLGQDVGREGFDLVKGRELLLPRSFFKIAGPDLRCCWMVSEKVTSGHAQSLRDFDLAGRPHLVDIE
ncbi:hypothetical protein [Caulobacter sp. DWR1-3-2b1]|uniref:hypothetical protein n=1 Tax=Caulobacter sp. DWR1-3-2b1 TaxID=2804670 RepID=UPI003CEC2601